MAGCPIPTIRETEGRPLGPSLLDTIFLDLQCIIGINQVSPMRGKMISIALTIRSLDPRLPELVCSAMVVSVSS